MIPLRRGTSNGERYEGTLIGYIEDSVAAVKQWEFRPVIEVAPLKPVPSLASITFIYDEVRTVPGRTINIHGQEMAVSTRAVPGETHPLASNCRFSATGPPNGQIDHGRN